MHRLLDRLRSLVRSRSTARTGPGSSGSSGGSGGLVVPSPVVMLTIVAVAMAAIAFVVTRNPAPTERQIATASQPEVRPTHTAAPAHSEAPRKPKPPAVDRGKVYVEVFNNSGISGLAGSVGSKAGTAGWKVVGTDNWYGSIPTNTVYFPPRLAAAGKQLALDLGVRRTAPAVAPMKFDRLTVILTAPLA